MKLNNFNIQNVRMENNNIYYNNNILSFELNEFKIPFGLENEYNKYLLKLEVEESNLLINIIEQLENKLQNMYPNIKCKSTIRKNKNFKNLLICKLKEVNNKFCSSYYCNRDDRYLSTILDLKKNDIIKCKIKVGKYWNMNNKVGIYIEITEIILI